LKRIIHDLSNYDKNTEIIKYNLAGGNEMLTWGKTHLDGERNLIKNKKELRKKTDEISNITGMRKNSYLKKHRKKFNFNLPVNLVKSNSNKTSINPITSIGLFEEIKKIKKFINY
jgi:hypothetical protein